MTWLPGYEQVPILGCTGPGSYAAGYPWRIVLHTTESPFGSGAGIINFFRGQPCSTPHFMLDPGTGRKVQFIPIDYSAAALRGGQGGYETNRGRAIQVEICGRADDAAGWSDDVLAFIGGWIADVVNAGYPINLDNVTSNDYRGTVATARSPYRMSGERWKNFDGVCGHIDVFNNDHYDPYRLDKARVVAHAKAKLGHPQEEDDMTPQDLADWACQKKGATPDEFLSAIGQKAAYWTLRARAEGQPKAGPGPGNLDLPDVKAAVDTLTTHGPVPPAEDRPTVLDRLDRVGNATGAHR